MNSDNEVQVLKNGGGGRKPSVSRPVSPASGNAANGGQGSESSEDEREGSTFTHNRTVGTGTRVFYIFFSQYIFIFDGFNYYYYSNLMDLYLSWIGADRRIIPRLRIRIRMDRHYFCKPDPHYFGKPDPDPHYSESWIRSTVKIALEGFIGAMDGGSRML